MKIEQANEISKKALEQIAQALERGEGEALKSYLAKMSQFHNYSFRNTLMIFAQNPQASRVAGFCAWKALGRFVKKGEKGIVIIAPMVKRSQSEEAPSMEEVAIKGKEGILIGYKAAYVFDISQTEGEELSPVSTILGNPQHYLAKLKEFISSLAIKVEYVEQGGGLYGFSSGGKITINPLMNTNPAVEFSTLVHELAHELMHRHVQEQSKTVQETEAEAVAAVVSQAIGLEAVQAATDYIQLYQGDTQTLQASLESIQNTANKILIGILEGGSIEG